MEDQQPVISVPSESGYSEVNGIMMYYEIYGAGEPLVLTHGGGSTIQTSFATVIPFFAQYRKVIAMELEAHGRTNTRGMPLSFRQDADDVAGLLANLGILKAEILGFSNGATTALELAIRYPETIGKLVLCSPLAKRIGMPPAFWEFMKNASLDNMPQELQDAFLQVNPNEANLKYMHDCDVLRMLNFEDIPDEAIESVQVQVLIINGDRDVITSEHVLQLSDMFPHGNLAILPGIHGAYLGEITTRNASSQPWQYVVPMILEFLR